MRSTIAIISYEFTSFLIAFFYVYLTRLFAYLVVLDYFREASKMRWIC